MKAVAFDVDGTLINEKSSWLTLHNYFNTRKLAETNLELYNNGKINYSTFMKKDIQLWGKKIHIDEIDNVLSKFTIHPKAREIVNELNSNGFSVLLISAGIDVLVEKVASNLQVKHYVSNGLETDAKGYLTGNGIFRVDLLRKDIALSEKLKEINVKPENCIAVGDSRYDIKFLEFAGKSIMVGNDQELKKYAHHAVNDLAEISKLI